MTFALQRARCERNLRRRLLHRAAIFRRRLMRAGGQPKTSNCRSVGLYKWANVQTDRCCRAHHRRKPVTRLLGLCPQAVPSWPCGCRSFALLQGVGYAHPRRPAVAAPTKSSDAAHRSKSAALPHLASPAHFSAGLRPAGGARRAASSRCHLALHRTSQPPSPFV